MLLGGSGRREQRERLGAPIAWRRVVDAQGLAVGVRDRQLLVAELQGAELRVLDLRGPAALWSRVVARPKLAKALAPDRELSDELVQLWIVDFGAESARSAATIAAAARSQSS